MIRIALVDDAVEIGTQLEAILIEITTNKGIAIDTDIYYSGKELCEHLQNGEFYDLIFLDIEMPEFTGIDVSKMIRDNLKNDSTQIAYISGNKEYAIEIFEYDPLYFVHKPINKEKIEKVFERLIHRLHLQADAFTYKTGHDIVKIPIKDIIYFGSLRNVGVVKSICKQVQMAAYQCSNHGISATGGFISHGYSFFRNRVSFVN